MKTLILAVSLLIIPVQDTGGFSFTGETIDDMELKFDPKGLSLADAEAAAKSILRVKMQIMGDPTFQARAEMMEFESQRRRFAPLLTKTAYTSLLGEREKELAVVKKLLPKMNVDTTFTVKDRKEKDGATWISFDIRTKAPTIHRECDAKGCEKCEEGLLTRERTEKSTVVVVKSGEEWKVKNLLRACYSCEGTGECKRHEEENCMMCKGDKKCRECKTTGFIPDGFLRGPSKSKGLPKVDETEPDFSAPGKTVEALLRAQKNFRIVRGSMEHRMVKPYVEFVTYFLADPEKIDMRERDYKEAALTLGETKKVNDTKSTVLYTTEGEEAPFRATVISVDGKWMIDALERPCWNCQGKGKNPYEEGKECDSCKGQGYQPIRSLR